MRTTIIFLSTILALSAASTIGPKASNTVPAEIEQLDQCIQNRFVDMRSFGMRRVLPRAYHGILNFEPENQVETTVVQQLKAKNYEVVFYLIGRGALGQTQQPFPNPRRAGVQGPAFVTPSRDFPTPEELLTDGRTALTSMDTRADHNAGYTIRHGDWTIAMRPLRATQGHCVQCHVSQGSTGLKVGDALGVAMYAHRPR